jgi:Domain of unknown function (DUF4438)
VTGQAGQASQAARAVAVNLLGLVEHPELGDTPYRVSGDGRPYVPAGDGGIVLGLRLGDSSFGRDADHAAPGACLVHPDPAARHALTIYSCIGNQVTVRTGQAAGARGVVIGKRGELGRVVVSFDQQDLERMRPADQIAVRTCGQGWRPPGFPAGVTLLNTDPAALRSLPITSDGMRVTAGVRAVVPSKLAGNGIGRPAVGWDLDLQLGGPAAVGRDGPGATGARADPSAAADEDVLLGDLVAVCDLDARFNLGYRRGWLTVGVIVHGASPLPGHGPGITPILTGPAEVLQAAPDRAGHVGLTESVVRLLTVAEFLRQRRPTAACRKQV